MMEDNAHFFKITHITTQIIAIIIFFIKNL